MRFALICGFLLAFATQAVNAERFFSRDTGCADAACDDTADCVADEGCTKCAGCGPCFVWGKDTFLKVGAGLRASYNAIENGNPNGGTRQDFNVNNARIYMNGQGHKRIGFEFNTDINNAQAIVPGNGWDLHGVNGFSSMDEGELRILDAIVKFQITDNIGLWMGRFLPPSDRANLSGPFFQNAWNFPFTQIGFPNIFQGRDDGAALWGQYGGGVVKWSLGVFEGENSGAATAIGQPGTDNLMVNGRFVVNLLDPEPGYYNASTYYGEKDILALGGSFMHRKDALASTTGVGAEDYTGYNMDFLFERKLSNCGVVTFEAAYYDFDDDNGGYVNGAGDIVGVTLPPSGGYRQGESYFALGSYLFPRKFCLFNVNGQFQAMLRYQEYDRDSYAGDSSDSVSAPTGAIAAGTDEQWDIQLNYIMYGHNARISAVWSQLDDGISGESNIDTITVGTQLQF